MATETRLERDLDASDTAKILTPHLDSNPTAKKHERLLEAIVQAVGAGTLRPGDKLPPEPVLADVTGISLGTVRRALTKLANYGVVSREHGRGTFILRTAQSANDLWHARFIDEDGNVMPLDYEMTRRKVVTKKGPWENVLPKSGSGYILIERRAIGPTGIVCCYEFYVSADDYIDLLTVSESQIETFGLRSLMASRFNVPTLSVTKHARMKKVDARMARLLGVETGHHALVLDIVGLSFQNEPISFLALTVPEGDWTLDLGVFVGGERGQVSPL